MRPRLSSGLLARSFDEFQMALTTRSQFDQMPLSSFCNFKVALAVIKSS